MVYLDREAGISFLACANVTIYARRSMDNGRATVWVLDVWSGVMHWRVRDHNDGLFLGAHNGNVYAFTY